MAENPNTNCLEGMKCPNGACGSFGPFQIEISRTVMVFDSGTGDDASDTNWDDDSWCHCPECGHTATVKDFADKEDIEEATAALKSHTWTGCQRGGDPTDAGSAEYVRYCSVCGMEDTCEDPLPACPGKEEANG